MLAKSPTPRSGGSALKLIMKKQTTEEKRENEFRVVTLMIQIYCKGRHRNPLALKNADNLCDECKTLRDYVRERVEKCPFMETKTFCSMCRVHCYKADRREKIREVMRFSGPRMLRYHPILAIRHVILTIKMKNENGKRKEI